jgi:hypothetical protein
LARTGRECESRRNRRDEPHAIEAVVDGHPQALDAHGFLPERADEREGEKTVRDRALERRLLRARSVDMDPLPIFGGLCKPIDPCLRDVEPVADREFRIEPFAESRDLRDPDHRAMTCGSASA